MKARSRILLIGTFAMSMLLDRNIYSADILSGWFCSINEQESLRTMAITGGRLVVAYSRELDPKIYLQFLSAAERNGVRCILQLPPSLVISGDEKSLAAIINACQRYTSLYGWLLFDEPDNSRVIIDNALRQTYSLVHAISKGKKVFLILRHPNVSDRFVSSCDVVLTDDYPIDVSGATFGTIASDSFSKRIYDFSNLAHKDHKEFGAVLQAFGANASGVPQFGKRLPTRDELLAMVSVAFLNKAQYVFFWVYYRSNDAWATLILQPALTAFLKTIGPLQTRDCVTEFKNGTSLAIVSPRGVTLAAMNLGLFETPNDSGLLDMGGRTASTLEPCKIYLKDYK